MSTSQNAPRPISAQPMYVQFAVELARRIEESGIDLVHDESTGFGLPDNKGWIKIEVRGGDAAGQKIYVPKSKTKLGRLHTTLDLTPNIAAGVLPLPRPATGKEYSNGAIRAHLEPDVEKAAAAFIDCIYSGVGHPTRRLNVGQQARSSNGQGQGGQQAPRQDDREEPIHPSDLLRRHGEQEDEAQEQHTGR